MWFVYLFLGLIVFFTIIEYPVILLALFILFMAFVALSAAGTPLQSSHTNSARPTPAGWGNCSRCGEPYPRTFRQCKCGAMLPWAHSVPKGGPAPVIDRKQNSNPISSPTGGVYLLKSGRFYKIGKASVFDRRIKQIKLQQPEPVEVVHKIYTHNADEEERQWHKRFASKRRNGEWFELSEADVAEFKGQS
jgi:hypothetical protein